MSKKPNHEKTPNHEGDIVNNVGVQRGTNNLTNKKATINHGNQGNPTSPKYTPPKKTK